MTEPKMTLVWDEALTKLLRERDELRAQLAKTERLCDLNIELAARQLSELATARSVAFAEAAQYLEGDHRPNCYDRYADAKRTVGGTIIETECRRCSTAKGLTAMAPLAPTLRVVPAEVLAKALEAGEDRRTALRDACNALRPFVAFTTGEKP